MHEASELRAKFEIAELITRYAALNDTGDWEAVAHMYTEQGRMSRPTAPDEFLVGRTAILAAFRARPRRATRHIVANLIVSLQDEARASATSQILLYIGSPATDGGLPLPPLTPPLIGSFQDRLVRTGEGWRFSERRGSLDFRAPG
jgi:3-phenylpropionate/cinnamic acid dioxygenase small subunit